MLSNAQLDYMIQKFYNETALLESLAKGHVFYLAQNEQEKFVGFVSYEINCEPNKTKIHKNLRASRNTRKWSRRSNFFN